MARASSRVAPFLAAVVCVCASSMAQTFPSRPIRVVVPFPPGGVDVTFRYMQPAISSDLGQPVVIENRPGANGYIGSELVARSAPDGYTLLATSSSTLVSGPFISRDVPFNTLKDFTPIAQFFKTMGAIVVKPSLPVNTLSELIDYAKRSPGKLSYGSSGVGSAQHLDGELFKLAARVDMVHVPYKGGGPQVQALVAQEIDVSFHPLQQVRPYLASAKAKILAVYGAGSRFPNLPDVPDVTETLPRMTTSPSWVGLFAPAGLPQPVLARLNSAVVKALGMPEVRPKIEENAVVVANSPEEFVIVMRGDVEKAAALVKQLKAAGVQLE